jgi:hypothetical protein
MQQKQDGYWKVGRKVKHSLTVLKCQGEDYRCGLVPRQSLHTGDMEYQWNGLVIVQTNHEYHP